MQRVPRLVDAADVPLEGIDVVFLVRILLGVGYLLSFDQESVPAVHHFHGTERSVHHERRRDLLLVEEDLGEILQQRGSRRRSQLELLFLGDTPPKIAHGVVFEQSPDLLFRLVNEPTHNALDVGQIHPNKLPSIVTVQRSEGCRHPVLDHLHLHLDHQRVTHHKAVLHLAQLHELLPSPIVLLLAKTMQRVRVL